MYLISILLLIILYVGYSVRVTGNNIFYYLDPISFIFLILLALPILISAGLLKDFNNAFRLSVKRKESCGRTELLRAIEAVTLAIKALLASGIFCTVFDVIQITATKEGVMLAKCISVSFVTLIYAIFFSIILLPLKARLVVRLHEFPENQKTSDTTDSAKNNTRIRLKDTSN